MTFKSLISTPKNLKDFYHIPDRKNPNEPIKIGLFELDSVCSLKSDLISYYKNYIKSYDTSFNIWINRDNSVIFKGANKDTAKKVWNGDNTTINNIISNEGPDVFDEASLDVQVVVGNCKLGLNTNDKLYIYQEFNNEIDNIFLNFIDYLIDNKNNLEIPKIWSVSYSLPYFFDIELAIKINDLTKKGFQVFFSSGDNGSSNNFDIENNPIYPNVPVSYPYITAIGGTKIVEDETTGDIIEIPSSSFDAGSELSNLITSGGGMEGVFLIKNNGSYDVSINPIFTPDEDFLAKQHLIANYIQELSNSSDPKIYQSLIIALQTYNSINNFYPLLYPDISFQSANYYIIVLGVSNLVAGTSASTPLFASMFAIITANNSRKYNFGKLNIDILNAYLDASGTIFKPVYSLNGDLYNNNTTENTQSKYGWDVAYSRKKDINPSGNGIGLDAFIGFGSMDISKFENYIKVNGNFISELKPIPKPQYNPILSTFKVDLYFSLDTDNILEIYTGNFAIDISNNLMNNYIYIYFDNNKNVVNKATDKYLKILITENSNNEITRNFNETTTNYILYISSNLNQKTLKLNLKSYFNNLQTINNFFIKFNLTYCDLKYNYQVTSFYLEPNSLGALTELVTIENIPTISSSSLDITLIPKYLYDAVINRKKNKIIKFVQNNPQYLYWTYNFNQAIKFAYNSYVKRTVCSCYKILWPVCEKKIITFEEMVYLYRYLIKYKNVSNIAFYLSVVLSIFQKMSLARNMITNSKYYPYQNIVKNRNVNLKRICCNGFNRLKYKNFKELYNKGQNEYIYWFKKK